jgi:hypothetical protein
MAKVQLLIFLFSLLFLTSCDFLQENELEDTKTATPSITITNTCTKTGTSTPTITLTYTITPSLTATFTLTPTLKPVFKPTITLTPTYIPEVENPNCWGDTCTCGPVSQTSCCPGWVKVIDGPCDLSYCGLTPSPEGSCECYCGYVWESDCSISFQSVSGSCIEDDG